MAAAASTAMKAAAGFLSQAENIANVAQLGQAHFQHRESMKFAKRAHHLDSQSIRLDALDHSKEEIRSHYDTYASRIDTLLLVLTLIWPFALNTIQFSDPFVPVTEEVCPDCVEVEHQWLVGIWVLFLGLILILPFWGILMMIRCKLRLDAWLESALKSLNDEKKVIVRSSPIQEDNLSRDEADAKQAQQDRATEEIVLHLVDEVLKYQEKLASIWSEECGALIHGATMLFIVSSGAALLLVALSLWIFLINKGGAHATYSVFLAFFVPVGLLVPCLYVIFRRYCAKTQDEHIVPSFPLSSPSRNRPFLAGRAKDLPQSALEPEPLDSPLLPPPQRRTRPSPRQRADAAASDYSVASLLSLCCRRRSSELAAAARRL